MHFMIHFTRKEGESMSPPSPEGMAEMGALMKEGFQSGTIVSTGQLSSPSTYITVRGSDVTLSEGPFIEGKELIPGFTVIQVGSTEDAIAWATRLRRCMGDGEIRLTRLGATSQADIAG